MMNFECCNSQVLPLFDHLQGRGNKSSGDNFHAAPNIDHSQEFVRNDIKEWLCWLRLVISFKFFCFCSMLMASFDGEGTEYLNF